MVDVRYWNRSLVFHKLSFSIHSLGCTIPHDFVIIIENWVHRKGPSMNAGYTEDILERNGFFVTLIHRVGSLFLQSIDRSNTGHETITYIHQHTWRKQKGSNAEQGHDTDQVNHHRVERTLFVRAKKVIPTKKRQRVGCTSPRVDKEEKEVLCFQRKQTNEWLWGYAVTSTTITLQDTAIHGGRLTQISSSDTIVHPGTMMVHSTNTSITNSAMVRHGWLEGLALATHGMAVFHESLAFTGNGLNGYTSRICQWRLGVAGQCHATQ